MPVAILCGGKGTRLAPLTDTIPKSLVDVCGQPFILHQLALLKRNGYTDIVLLLGHRGEQIIDVVNRQRPSGFSVTYVEDGPQPLGCDGAIMQAMPLLGREFFVLYGDSYLDCPYQAIEETFKKKHPRIDALLTMYGGEGYGLRAFRRFPARTVVELTMPTRFQEIGSHAGLADVRDILSRRDGPCDRAAERRGD